MKRIGIALCLLAASSCTAPVTQPTTTTVRLRCSPSGDNGSTGCASVYDLRWSYDSAAIANVTNWAAMNQAVGEPTPRCPGTNVKDTFVVSGMPSDTVIFFSVRVGDEVPNWSPLSNIPRVRTPDGIGPSPVIDLEKVN